MFRTAWTFGHLRGVPLRLHISLLFVLPLVSFGVAFEAAPMVLARLGIPMHALTLPPLALGVALALALFVAVLLHELGHALVALRQGARVRAITLMVLGGITEIDHDDARPAEALWMAFAGPLVNLALGALSLSLARLPLGVDLHAFLLLFGLINLFLAAFNLVPAFPLDGGRMLKAALRFRMSEEKATRVAALIGRTLAAAGMVAGLMWGDIFLAVVALFLFTGAGAELSQVQVRTALDGLAARQAMVTRVVTVGPARPVTSVARHMLFHDAQAAIVCDHAGTYGVLLPPDLTEDAAEAGDLVDGEPLWAHVDDPLGPVVREMRWSRKPVIVRDDFNAPVGVITIPEITRAARLRRLADRALMPGPRPVESEETGA